MGASFCHAVYMWLRLLQDSHRFSGDDSSGQWSIVILHLSDDIAFKIYQAILDGSGDAVNLRSFDRYHPFFQLPSVLETFEGRTMVETRETLKFTFDKIQDCLSEMGATRMERTCSVAQFNGSDTIRGMHDTRLLDSHDTVLEAYSGMCTLRLIDGHWCVSVSQFVEETVSLPSKTLRSITDETAAQAAAQ